MTLKLRIENLEKNIGNHLTSPNIFILHLDRRRCDCSEKDLVTCAEKKNIAPIIGASPLKAMIYHLPCNKCKEGDRLI